MRAGTMSALLFCDSFVHEAVALHLDEIVFKHPVRINGFLVVPDKLAPHPAEVQPSTAPRCSESSM